MTTMIAVENIRARDIQIAANEAGITLVEYLGDNGKAGDERVTVYRIGDVRVAATNGDSVWEEQDIAAFRELVESEGIESPSTRAARELGRMTSEAKAAAARENGKKGGRPRKSA